MANINFDHRHSQETHSLQRRYLLGSAVIATILLTVSLATTYYINQVTAENNHSLTLVDTLNKALARIHHALRLAEIAIQNQVSSPTEDQQQAIRSHLQQARSIAFRISHNTALHDSPLLPSLLTLKTEMDALAQLADTFITKRKDTNWIYPALPYINVILLQSNTHFDKELALSLEETQAMLPDPAQVKIYLQLTDLRDLWRRMILNFRAAMIRFAGLPNVDPAPQERNIELIYQTIAKKLVQLNANPDKLPYGLQTEDSLRAMQHNAANWHAHFQQIRQLRANGQWRGDVRYIEQKLRPQQRQVEQTLDKLTRNLQSWSVGTTLAVGKAAARINQLLWVMSAIGLLVIALLYFLLDRNVLRPVARVANALSAAARGQTSILLSPHSTREIATLVDAFEHMHRQVQGRQQSLEFLALHDVLTSLPNRALLADRLTQGLAGCQRKETKLALLLLDLDRFKEINDSLGHQVGDQVLQEVAHRLLPLLRDADTVARLGGDEFAVVVPDIDHDTAVAMARRISETLKTPYHHQGHPLYVGVSIGIAMAPEDGNDPDTLLRHADGAMYTAKHNHLDHAFFDQRQDLELTEALQLLARLRDALATGRGLQLYYQPKVSLSSGSIIGVEALLRWRSPDGQWISPERIVQIAENANLIRELTNWVLNRAIADCTRFTAENGPLNIAINLSARDLQDKDLPEVVAEALHRHRLPARQLTLEITENAVLSSPDLARMVLTQLAEQGTTLSIDDFGTGYSSLAHLKLLPVHELKIDKSFVLNMQHNESDAVIVHSTIDLGHNLSLQVVAEGVEDKATRELLRARHCDIIQGYLVSAALSADELLALLRHQSGNVA